MDVTFTFTNGATSTSSTSWFYVGGPMGSDFGPPRRTPPDDDGLAGVRAVLGVPPDLPPDGLRAAYRQRLKEAHPDLGGSEDEVRRVIEAYKVLSS